GEICARESHRASGNHRDIDVFSQRDLSNVNRKDSLAPSDVGPGNNHAPVKTAWAQQCRVENIRPVGCSNQDNAFVGFKAVHLDKQLVQCLLTLVMSAAEARSALPSDCVDFIYKDDARGVLLALLEQIANARGTHADEHFDEIRSADREERNIGFARDCPREKCFPGTRGTEEQYASRNPSAKLLELPGFLQKVDDFLQLFFGFLYAGNIFKCNFLLMRREHPRPALAERHDVVAAALHLTHKEHPKPD